METELKETSILKFRPNTIESIRKEFNLDQPGRMDEAIKIIEGWIQKQEHFANKNFERGYLERFIINNKGLLERVKARLDKKCTVVNLTKIIGPYKVTEFKHTDAITHAAMPMPTEDFKRIYMLRVNPNHELSSEAWMEVHKTNAIALEYHLRYDYTLGFHFILDLLNVNLLNVISSFNFGDMREYQSLLLGTQGIRMRSVHVMTTSKVAESFTGLLKQMFSSFKYEVYLHKNLESLYNHIPRELLPMDYGGEQDTFDNIAKKYAAVLSSEDHLNHLRWVCQARTDESRRSADKFNEIMGTQGTFRSLNVD